MNTHSSRRPHGVSQGGFAATQWSLVAALGEAANDSPVIAELCRRYWYPVYAFARSSGSDPQTAQEQVRDFFARLLASPPDAESLSRHGRFRHYLLDRLDHFRTDAPEAGRDRTPSPSFAPDTSALEMRYRQGRNEGTPVMAFQRGFALQVLALARERLRAEAEQSERGPLYEALVPYLSAQPEGGRMDDWMQQFGMSASALEGALNRLRQRFRELVDATLVETLAGPGELAAERAELRRLLGGSG